MSAVKLQIILPHLLIGPAAADRLAAKPTRPGALLLGGDGLISLDRRCLHLQKIQLLASLFLLFNS